MTQYNDLNEKLSNSQLNKLKSGIKNDTEVTSNFHQMLLVILMMRTIFCINCYLTNTQLSKLCEAFANNSSANIKLSQNQSHKIGQSGGFLGRLFGRKLDCL